jgi:hypothetical protein
VTMAVFNPMNHQNPPEDLEALRTLAHQARQHWCDMPCVQGLLGPPCEMVEVGSWAGQSALVFCEAAVHVYCVDNWEGNPEDHLGDVATRLGHAQVYTTFCKNMGDLLYRKVFPVHCASTLAAESWPRKVALVYIDARHAYASVRSDILAWRNHVIPGGILCGHDYSGLFPDVVRAVYELVPRDDLCLVGHSVWWTKVR